MMSGRMNSDDPLLRVSSLNVHFGLGAGAVRAIADVGFTVRKGERVGIVGESGCGKTVTGLALMGLLPRHGARVTGQVLMAGRNLLELPPRAMQRVRGRQIAMIFQEPMSALDPVFTIGEQISETLRAHFRIGRAEARERAVAALEAVGIPLPGRRYGEYPHQLSGGMRQRAMIAIALACEPRLLIADEPTTALDVTIQAQIIDLLLELSNRIETALLFITHDLGVVARACTRLLTMYAGEIVEDADLDAALVAPRHPYTSGLLRSLPRLTPRKSRLPSIAGQVPSPAEMPDGCRFAPRCPHRGPVCADPVPLVDLGDRRVRCARHAELSLRGCADALEPDSNPKPNEPAARLAAPTVTR
jgi:peptide/nickel transport system ATP-binding protein